MKFEHESGTTFEVPDRPTVRQQLEYLGATAGVVDNKYLIRFWIGALEVITDWKSETLPDVKASLDDMTDAAQTDLIIWAGLKVREHMSGLEKIPKN